MRLHRPHVPFGVKLTVALRQLAAIYGVNVIDLQLDHDPPLALRPQHRRGLGKKTYYIPDANDPDYLRWRCKAAHDVKTRVRGDHGQYSDLALIRREKRRARKTPISRTIKWPKRKMKSRPFPKRSKR